MKRLLLVIFSAMFFVACSSPATNDTNEADEKAVHEAEETDEESGIEVDKGLFNVELTLPASLFEDEELAEIEANIKEERDAEVSQNPDGSISVKMSKKDHQALMAEMKTDFIESIDEIVADEEFASIKDITYNKDFTELTMVVEREPFENSLDGFATFSLGLGSMFYQAFDGKDLEKQKVKIFLQDEATDEMYQEIIYPDTLHDMEEELE